MSTSRKAQQWRVMALMGVGGVTLIGTLGWVLNNADAGIGGLPESQSVDPTIIADVTSAASPELSWIAQSRSEIEKLTAQVGELTSTITAMKEEETKAIADLTAQYDDALLRQQQDINALKGGDPASAGAIADAAGGALPGGDPTSGASGIEAQSFDTAQDFVSGAPNAAPLGGLPGNGGTAGQGGALASGFGTSFTLAAAPGSAAQSGVNGPPQAAVGDVPPGEGGSAPETESHVRKLESYVPAGSYAPAMVIAGVDASAGVKSQENPVPVLLRLTGPVTTAAAGAGQGARVDLTGCTVVGSAAADLSAERVYVRLTTMTCLNRRGEILEVPVAGIVVGSGKAGVRGKVVSREGSLVRSAAIAGVLQGIGQTASSSAQGITGSDGLDQTVTSIAGASAAGALGGGISNAADTLAQYYIQRAEQYQPVVSLYGGTSVEVVFLDGVDLK
jgi:conjugal transfer pilus assembly protein TraB